MAKLRDHVSSVSLVAPSFPAQESIQFSACRRTSDVLRSRRVCFTSSHPIPSQLLEFSTAQQTPQYAYHIAVISCMSDGRTTDAKASSKQQQEAGTVFSTLADFSHLKSCIKDDSHLPRRRYPVARHYNTLKPMAFEHQANPDPNITS